MKKKLLSLILAITMIATLLPAMALSAGAEDVGYTLTYDFGLSGNVATKTTVTTYDDYSETNGRWKYADKATGVGTVQTYISSHTSTGQGAAVEIKATALNQWAAFRIYVPVDGDYKATLNYTRRTATALCGNGHTYILDGDTTDIETALASATPLSDSLTKYDTTANRPNQVHNLNSTAKTLTEGEYIIVFRVEEAGANGGFYMYPQELTLTSGDGSLAAPMYGAVASIDTENIEVGKSANITVSGPMSDGSDITAANITYSSDNDCISVANGTVTGVSEGNANITTSVNGVALNTVTVNVAEAAPDYADYTFTYDFCSELANGTDLGTIKYDMTKALWSWNSKSRETLSIKTYGTGDNGRIDARTSVGYWFALNINVPVTGDYKVRLGYAQTDTNAGYGNVYLLPADTESIAEALDEAAPLNETEINYYYNSYKGETEDTDGIFELDALRNISAGEYILVFKCSRLGLGVDGEGGSGSQGRMYPKKLILEGDGTGEAYTGVVTLTDDELTVDGTATAEAKIYNATTGEQVPAAATFASTGNAVSVNDATVTANAVGEAEISATIDTAVPYNMIPAKVTVVDSTDDFVIFGVSSNIGDGIDFTVDGTLGRGDKVTLTADDVPGYKFVGWKRGNSLTGKFIKDAPQKDFEYRVYSNAFVTAIYEEENPTSATGVEFWNKNGELVAEYTAAEYAELQALPAASLIGHTHTGWQTADGEEFTLSTELKNGITRVIAKQEPISVSGPFACDDVTTELNESAMPFNSAITASTTSTTFSCWLRNNMIVSYDKDYTYYVWKTATIDNGKIDVPEDKKPLAVLDKGFGAYMLEYDAADYEIVEVGIVAGSGTPSVASASEKHIAQKTGNHGQFAAKLTQEFQTVRGYVIYRDEEDYKIVYAE
ncbi:MAG: hypothetical protein E7441_07555 [Ruminococcaceae bacterium]|nr:hypothetical protein [Oscillospiraceae bacterium]